MKHTSNQNLMFSLGTGRKGDVTRSTPSNDATRSTPVRDAARGASSHMGSLSHDTNENVEDAAKESERCVLCS
jgi:hypothetical protein